MAKLQSKILEKNSVQYNSCFRWLSKKFKNSEQGIDTV